MNSAQFTKYSQAQHRLHLEHAGSDCLPYGITRRRFPVGRKNKRYYKSMTQRLLIALGGNSSRNIKMIVVILRQGASLLTTRGNLDLIDVSPLYQTAPAGDSSRQPHYLNAVLSCRSSLTLIGLLRLCKTIEREAGRRKRGINASRPLDIDLIDFGGRCIGSRALRPRSDPLLEARAKDRHARQRTTLRKAAYSRMPRAWLTLPHPEMHRRRFVLEPLADIAPHWRHPVLERTARQLLARLPRPPGSIRRVLDSQWLSCDKH